jgi:hypothetical protein
VPRQRVTDGHRPRLRREHNRVEPGDAIGIAIRVPADRLQVVADLLAPGVPAERVHGLTGSVTIYPTIGRDSLNGRPVSHRWVNVMADPPAACRRTTGSAASPASGRRRTPSTGCGGVMASGGSRTAVRCA